MTILTVWIAPLSLLSGYKMETLFSPQ